MKWTEGHISSKAVSSTHLPNQSINEDLKTPIDGHKSTDGIPIDRSINGQTKWMEEHNSRTADSSTHLPTGLSAKTRRMHIFINTTTT